MPRRFTSCNPSWCVRKITSAANRAFARGEIIPSICPSRAASTPAEGDRYRYSDSISTPCFFAARLIRPLIASTSSPSYFAALSCWWM